MCNPRLREFVRKLESENFDFTYGCIASQFEAIGRMFAVPDTPRLSVGVNDLLSAWHAQRFVLTLLNYDCSPCCICNIIYAAAHSLTKCDPSYPNHAKSYESLSH